MSAIPPLLSGVKGIFFDLDGTIRENNPSAIQLILTAAEKRGFTTTAEGIREIVRTGHAFWGDREQVKQIKFTVDDERIFWQQFFKTYLQQMAVPEEMKEEMSWECGSQFFETMRLTDGLMADAAITLTGLKQRGYVIGLVSNRSQSLDEPLYRLGIKHLFDFTLSAGQANSWKPDALIYHLALQEAGDLKPEEAVFIGDNYYTDILGAEQAGLHAVLLDVYDAFTDLTNCRRINRLIDLLNIF